jgi:hypothetical protein
LHCSRCAYVYERLCRLLKKIVTVRLYAQPDGKEGIPLDKKHLEPTGPGGMEDVDIEEEEVVVVIQDSPARGSTQTSTAKESSVLHCNFTLVV